MSGIQRLASSSFRCVSRAPLARTPYVVDVLERDGVVPEPLRVSPRIEFAVAEVERVVVVPEMAVLRLPTGLGELDDLPVCALQAAHGLLVGLEGSLAGGVASRHARKREVNGAPVGIKNWFLQPKRSLPSYTPSLPSQPTPPSAT